MHGAAAIINLDAHRRPRVQIERMPDPLRPERTAYRLTGTNAFEVQEYITALLEEVEQPGAGFGRFIGPHHIGHGCYVALGEIIVTREIAK
jgi:hypothetical protein